tara:strand:+ start:6552 stop:7703 length:1152 start_codon:yes stop_codon:yes gene_type:complete
MSDLYGPLDEKKKKRKKAGSESSKESSLRDWFGRKGAKGKRKGWVDCNSPDGKGGYKSCGRSSGEKRKKYPACRPTPGACKERGKGKSWGKKAKKRKNEELYMDLEQLVSEELENVLDEKRKKKKKKKKKKGKKDACYHKVKSRYKVWPSAYASGALVKCRKVGAKNWGNSKKEQLQAIVEDEISLILQESHTKEHEEELEKIADELAGASKMHKGQSDRIKKILDQTDDDELKEEEVTENMNCGCGNTPCDTYGKVKVITVKEMAYEETQKFLEESLYYGLIEEDDVLEEKKKKKKACKPSKGKKFARRVKGRCVSYGQAGKAKGGGARIKPGTGKGNAYCARSYGDMKSHGKDCSGKDRGTPLCLSRQKWKCSGKYSRKGK